VDPPQGFEAMVLELGDWPDTVLAGESGTLDAALTLEGVGVDNAPIRWRSADSTVLWLDPSSTGETASYEVRRHGRVGVQVYVNE
jgi:hypothetical protein